MTKTKKEDKPIEVTKEVNKTEVIKEITKETWKEVEKMFSNMGQKCGNEIEQIAKKLHPDALFTLPVYRGCIVVLKQEDWEIERGSCTIKMYHDPHWMGQELNEKTLPDYCEDLQIFGQRSGHDLLRNGGELHSIEAYESMRYFNQLMKEQRATTRIRELLSEKR